MVCWLALVSIISLKLAYILLISPLFNLKTEYLYFVQGLHTNSTLFNCIKYFQLFFMDDKDKFKHKWAFYDKFSKKQMDHPKFRVCKV